MSLEVRDLSVVVAATGAPLLQNVSFTIEDGQTVAIVGESGSGKTTLANTVLGLLPSTLQVTQGDILLDGVSLLSKTEAEWRKLRGDALALVPQDPLTNLDPLYRVGAQVTETVRLHRKLAKPEAEQHAFEALRQAGLEDTVSIARRFPHQLSGGQRQRALIAIGTANRPKLLVADEPTSALDVTVQRRILDRLQRIQAEHHTAILLITHDLRIAAERADRVLVLQRGVVAEQAAAATVFAAPQSPYSRALVNAATVAPVRARQELAADSETVLSLRNVSYTYPGTRAPAVSDINLNVRAGETLALVGESGSGKSTATRAVLGLLHGPVSGTIEFEGSDIRTLTRATRPRYRRLVRTVSQDPGASLNPAMTVKHIIQEPLRRMRLGDPAHHTTRVLEALTEVGLSAEHATRLPRELSGGQKQRVAIARALITDPQLIICDEPISALDVIVQQQVLELLARLQSERQVAYLFITHDLAVARRIAHSTAVMQNGRVVEQGRTEQVFERPQHPYTNELLAAIPAFAPAA